MPRTVRRWPPRTAAWHQRRYGRACAALAAGRTSRAMLMRGARQAAGSAGAHVTIDIVGMTCASCVHAIETNLGARPGVRRIAVSLERRCADIEYDPSLGERPEALCAAIDDMGFEASLRRPAANGHVDAVAAIAAAPRSRRTRAVRAVHFGDSEVIELSALGRPGAVRRWRVPTGRADDDAGDDAADGGQGSSGGDDDDSEDAAASRRNGSAPSAQPQRAVLSVKGMVCASCTSAIETALRALHGIHSASVNLLLEKVSVDYDARTLTPEAIAAHINDIGYSATVLDEPRANTIHLAIRGMTCASCVGTIETNLAKVPGVQTVSVSLLTGRARITHDPHTIGIRDIVAAIDRLGFEASPVAAEVDALRSVAGTDTDAASWRTRFLVCLCFVLPSMILEQLSMRNDSVRAALDREPWPGVTLMNLIMLALASPVQWAIGYRFYVSAYKSLRHRSANMDVLVSLGTLCAYVYSLFALVVAAASGSRCPETFFQAGPMLFAFVCLGRYLEHLAKSRTSQALVRLAALRATEAVLLVPSADAAGAVREQCVSVDLVQHGVRDARACARRPRHPPAHTTAGAGHAEGGFGQADSRGRHCGVRCGQRRSGASTTRAGATARGRS